MKTLKTLALIGLLAILAAIGAAVYFFGGLYSVAASAEEPAFVKWALVKVRQASIERHAKDRPAISLDDPATVQSESLALLNTAAVQNFGTARMGPPELGPLRPGLFQKTGTDFWKLETANLYEFSTCFDASVIVAPQGGLLIVCMAHDPHGNQNDGCAEDYRDSYPLFYFASHFCLNPSAIAVGPIFQDRGSRVSWVT